MTEIKSETTVEHVDDRKMSWNRKCSEMNVSRYAYKSALISDQRLYRQSTQHTDCSNHAFAVSHSAVPLTHMVMALLSSPNDRLSLHWQGFKFPDSPQPVTADLENRKTTKHNEKSEMWHSWRPHGLIVTWHRSVCRSSTSEHLTGSRNSLTKHAEVSVLTSPRGGQPITTRTRPRWDRACRQLPVKYVKRLISNITTFRPSHLNHKVL
jgi:hypothetical protein